MRKKALSMTLFILLTVSLLFAVSLSALGGVRWNTNGVGIRTTSANNAISPQITSDGSGGAIVAWQDYRDGHYDIYSQRIDAVGNPYWPADGTGVRIAPGGDAGQIGRAHV